MNEEVKVKWLTALRSGEFTQARAGLRRSYDGQVTGHCCLGVLCELYRREHPISNWNDIDEFESNAGERWGTSGAYLPEPVQQWAGLTGRDPYVSGYGYIEPEVGQDIHHVGISIINDKDVPFTSIANIIEAQL